MNMHDYAVKEYAKKVESGEITLGQIRDEVLRAKVETALQEASK